MSVGQGDRSPGPLVDAAPFGDEGFDALLAKIERERAFACGLYKARCLQRRIAARVRARGAASFADYAAMLDGDPVEYDRLLGALTVNVTKFYRNRSTFEALGQQVIPALAALPDEEVRIWSAGCASGEEPYTLAMLCTEHDATRPAGRRALASRVRIVGTDLDRDSLRTADGGRFPEASFAELPTELRERYFLAPARVEIAPAQRAMVRFERRDLLVDPLPVADAHLIVCRNVLIYFDRPTQEALLERFHAALAPGGFLVLGKVEMLLGRARSLFANVEARERIYLRR